MSEPGPSPASGWFADPSHRFAFRYWSGDEWSDRVLTTRSAAEERDVLEPALAETLPVVRSREDRHVIGSVSEAFCLKRYAQELEKRRHDELGMPKV